MSSVGVKRPRAPPSSGPPPSAPQEVSKKPEIDKSRKGKGKVAPDPSDGGPMHGGGGGIYTDNGLPYGSANPQELAAGKMLRGAGRRRTRKVRIPVKHSGDLTNLGYSLSKKSRTRHGAIKKAVKKFGRATVSRKLNALAIFNKRRYPATARKARADRKYAMTQ